MLPNLFSDPIRFTLVSLEVLHIQDDIGSQKLASANATLGCWAVRRVYVRQ